MDSDLVCFDEGDLGEYRTSSASVFRFFRIRSEVGWNLVITHPKPNDTIGKWLHHNGDV